MLIEALKPLALVLSSGEVKLVPGLPLTFTAEDTEEILLAALDNVSPIKTEWHDWLVAWRVLATITAFLTTENAQLKPVIRTMYECDDCFWRQDWEGFVRVARRVWELVKS